MRLRISEKVVGSKLDKFGEGIIGKRKGSGESDGENLERMRSILSLKNWRNELASDCVSGASISGDELNGPGCGGELNLKFSKVCEGWRMIQ